MKVCAKWLVGVLSEGPAWADGKRVVDEDEVGAGEALRVAVSAGVEEVEDGDLGPVVRVVGLVSGSCPAAVVGEGVGAAVEGRVACQGAG
jgi:hypothetical protein